MLSTNWGEPVHPSYCDQERCTRHGSVVAHASEPVQFIPRQPDTTEANTLVFTIERLDEIDESTGVQVEHPAEVVLDDDLGRRVRMGLEDLQELSTRVLEVHNCSAAFAVP